MKNFVYNDVHYKNLHVFCKTFGYNYTRLYGLHYTNDKEDIYTLIELYNKKPETIEYNGNVYKSYQLLCYDLGISSGLFRKNLNKYKGTKSLEEIVGLCKPLITYKGVRYSKLSQLCDNLGINSTYLYKLKSRYKDKDINELIELYYETIDTTKERQQYGQRTDSIIITYGGITYSSLRGFCDENNFNYKRFYRVLDKHRDDTIENIVNQYINEEANRKAIVYKGTAYSGVRALCRELDISYTMFLKVQKENQQATTDDLVTLVLNTNQQGFKEYNGGKSRDITYEGTVYKSISELCKAHDVNPLTYKYRKRKNPDKPIEFWLFGEKRPR